jgi:hypothetical protein
MAMQRADISDHPWSIGCGSKVVLSSSFSGQSSARVVGSSTISSLINPPRNAARSPGALPKPPTDVGIKDDLMKELAATMTPGSSTLFVLDDLMPSLTSSKPFRSSNVRYGMLVGGAGEVQTSTRI